MAYLNIEQRTRYEVIKDTLVIVYTCISCGKDHDILPDYLKYMTEYLTTTKQASLSCDNCGQLIPAETLYKNYTQHKDNVKMMRALESK